MYEYKKIPLKIRLFFCLCPLSKNSCRKFQALRSRKSLFFMEIPMKIYELKCITIFLRSYRHNRECEMDRKIASNRVSTFSVPATGRPTTFTGAPCHRHRLQIFQSARGNNKMITRRTIRKRSRRILSSLCSLCRQIYEKSTSIRGNIRQLLLSEIEKIIASLGFTLAKNHRFH